MTEDTFQSQNIELINDDNLNSLEAFASIVSLNPNVRWMKFILLDDMPNKNKQRIPQEEFDNVVKTGMYMPLKSEAGTTSGNHKASDPLGVITGLKKEGNHIIGLAALWEKERPEDIKMLKDSFDAGAKINVSWELNYNEEVKKEDYSDLLGITMNAATIVGLPAYAGRTPITALAEETGAENNSLLEGNSLEELEKITQERDALLVEKTQLAEKVTELEASIVQRDSISESIKTELTGLKEFKAGIDAVKEKETKITNLKKLFSDSGLEVEDDYFTDEERVSKLLAMDESSLNFMIQETVAFKKTVEASAKASVNVPHLNLKPKTNVSLTPAEIGRAMRDLDVRENK